MKIRKLNLDVKIGGNSMRPSSTRIEQYAASLPFCEIVLSGEERQPVNLGENVFVNLDNKRIFSGSLLSLGLAHGGLSYKCGHALKTSTVNFRREKASYVLNHLADQSGIGKRQMEIPDVELPHYHCLGDGWQNLLAFASSLSDWTDDEFDIFFDAFGVLNLKPVRDSGEAVFEFQRGKNTLLIRDKTLKAFPLPLGYGDTIKVNSKMRRALGLHYFISPQNSLMEVLF